MSTRDNFHKISFAVWPIIIGLGMVLSLVLSGMALAQFSYPYTMPSWFQAMPWQLSGGSSAIGFPGQGWQGSWASYYSMPVSGSYPLKGGYYSTTPFTSLFTQSLGAGQPYQYGWMASSMFGGIYPPQYSLSFPSYYMGGGYPISQKALPYSGSFSLWPYMAGGTKTLGNTPPLIQGTTITGRVIDSHTVDSNGKIISCYANGIYQGVGMTPLDLSSYIGMVVEVYGDLQMQDNYQGKIYGARLI